jgi:dinuclear metal center YbgI/SA1388 family protein
VAARDEILAFAADLLDLDAFPDYGPMGLQVEGAAEVSKVVCAVSASRDLFERAAEVGAQLVLVHHGIFWDKDSRVVTRGMRERLRILFDHDLTLAAYHLALDAHPDLGNNAQVCRQLGIEPERRFAGIGFGGPLERPTSADAFASRIREHLDRPPLVFSYGPEEIRRVAVLTGGGARYLDNAIAEGYDCYVTGEAAEPTKHTAKEAGIHFIAAGHYATETLGVQALAARIADEFGVEREFVDLPTPV